MKILLLAVGVAAINFFGGSVANADTSVDACIDKYGSYVKQIDGVDRGCRTLMFPSSPEFPAGYYQVSGNQVREFALVCQTTYGVKLSTISGVDGACATFYFPTGRGGEVKIKVTSPESGGLY